MLKEHRIETGMFLNDGLLCKPMDTSSNPRSVVEGVLETVNARVSAILGGVVWFELK